MFNETFKKIARWQLTDHSWDLARRARQDRYYRKKGYIVKFPNGTDGFDIVACHADTLKWNLVMFGVVYPAAAMIGRTLGNMNSKN